MIQVQALQKSFVKKGRGAKPTVAVSDVTFSANNGEITGLLGPNGAGKSTTLRMLVGLLTPDRGVARIDQWDAARDKYKVRKAVGYLPHNAGVYPRLTARENIVYFASLAGLDKACAAQRTEALIQLLSMQDFADRRAEGFSQGQRTKVALARALVHEPKNIVLDEPTNGLDVMATRQLRAILRRLRDAGHCILVSSHIMQEISLLCDQVAIISEGRVVTQNTVSGLLEQTGQADLEDAFVVSIGQPLEDEL